MEDPGGNIFDFDNVDGEYFSPNCKFFITTALGLSILKGSGTIILDCDFYYLSLLISLFICKNENGITFVAGRCN